jgi:tRNA pseudouridine32 synthase/23S rRNA pseudouridine746 synthase
VTRLQRTYPSASIVHRLDLDTSGIMVIPLNKPTHAHISRQFQQRLVEKSYHAVVYGLLREDRGEIDLPIACDWENRPRQIICHERGRPALTRFEVLERHTDRTRVLLQPVTGRSHQLRIHMRELGHPILGCDMYAHPQALAMAPRLMLHATTLAFEHPTTGERLAGECLPDF